MEVARVGARDVARVQVSRVWKGTVGQVVNVSDEAGTSCSFNFKRGEHFVFYGTGSVDTFSVQSCGGGGRLQDGDDPELPPIPGRVTGLLIRYKDKPDERGQVYDPIAHANVWLECDAGLLSTETDAEGTFALDNVPEGTHTVHADLGSNEESSERVALESSADCPFVFMMARPSGRITGRLLDLQGTPLTAVQLTAVRATHDSTSRDRFDVPRATTGPDGWYEFVGLKPGTYIVGVNVFDGPVMKQPFPATYYPGTERRDEAVAIEVAKGSTLSADPFIIARSLPTTELTARMVCRDGSRPRSGSVFAVDVSDHGFFGDSTYDTVTDTLRLPVLVNRVYDVEGSILIPAHLPDPSEHAFTITRTNSVRITSGHPPPVIQLIVPVDHCETTTLDANGR